MPFVAPPVVCRVVRGGVAECLHRGDMVFVDSQGAILSSVGNPWKVSYMRSSAKPVQALRLIESGAAERFGFTDREIAVICGSHSGQDEHVLAVRGILHRIGVPEQALGCGCHAPIFKAQADGLLRRGEQPSPVYNNCSGKHAGMLALAVHIGLPLDGYWNADHPIQAIMKRTVSEVSGFPEQDIVDGIDGCGVKVFALPIYNMALAYARLATPGSLPPSRSSAAARILGAMAANPLMVAGEGRLCTDLIAATQGRVVGKEGADGLYCAALRDRGAGFAFKVEDGNPRALGAVVVSALEQAGALDASELRRLEKWKRPEVINHRGEAVGFVEAVFDMKADNR